MILTDVPFAKTDGVEDGADMRRKAVIGPYERFFRALPRSIGHIPTSATRSRNQLVPPFGTSGSQQDTTSEGWAFNLNYKAVVPRVTRFDVIRWTDATDGCWRPFRLIELDTALYGEPRTLQ